ncbi:hypothetical protein K461DRAFT_270881 [Myriangium duriaei CBS 260.36]|uniref:Uncharacterized protein n=1 Tax=Myriangium duriaei CBS 260.36 TaxID=1168546 RepID=A0A9P4IVJ5_9PEZI|nr:hypothetical protein K461DRAFT_270881 [Myriangium duriaei CBS 260.36]
MANVYTITVTNKSGQRATCALNVSGNVTGDIWSNVYQPQKTGPDDKAEFKIHKPYFGRIGTREGNIAERVTVQDSSVGGDGAGDQRGQRKFTAGTTLTLSVDQHEYPFFFVTELVHTGIPRRSCGVQ